METLKRHFWNITFGHAMIIITILFALVVFLLNSKIADLAVGLRQEASERKTLTDNFTTQIDHIYWYKDQGINFKDARKYNIEPPKDNKK